MTFAKLKKEHCKIKSKSVWIEINLSDLGHVSLFNLWVRKPSLTEWLSWDRSTTARLGRNSDLQSPTSVSFLSHQTNWINPRHSVGPFLSASATPHSILTLRAFQLSLSTQAASHCCVEPLRKAQAQSSLLEIARLNVSKMAGGYIWLLMLWGAWAIFFWNGLMMTTSFYWSGISFPEGLTAGGMWNMEGLLHFV